MVKIGAYDDGENTTYEMEGTAKDVLALLVSLNFRFARNMAKVEGTETGWLDAILSTAKTASEEEWM